MAVDLGTIKKINAVFHAEDGTFAKHEKRYMKRSETFRKIVAEFKVIYDQ